MIRLKVINKRTSLASIWLMDIMLQRNLKDQQHTDKVSIKSLDDWCYVMDKYNVCVILLFLFLVVRF